MKTIGLISDTHIPTRYKQLPKSVLSTFEEVDLILHAGDLVSLSVADTLKTIAPLKAVHGNMCKWQVKNTFPEKLMIEVENLKIGLTHGSGGPSGYTNRLLQKFIDEKPDIIVSGHTHQPKAELVNGIMMLNPGSPTDSRNTVILLIVDRSTFEYQFVNI